MGPETSNAADSVTEESDPKGLHVVVNFDGQEAINLVVPGANPATANQVVREVARAVSEAIASTSDDIGPSVQPTIDIGDFLSGLFGGGIMGTSGPSGFDFLTMDGGANMGPDWEDAHTQRPLETDEDFAARHDATCSAPSVRFVGGLGG